MSREKVKKTMQKMWRRAEKIHDDELESGRVNELVDDLFDGIKEELRQEQCDKNTICPAKVHCNGCGERLKECKCGGNDDD